MTIPTEAEAREAVQQAGFCEELPCVWCEKRRPAVSASLDRYRDVILANTACLYAAFEEERQGTLPGYCERFPDKACPTCAARARLKKMA